MVDSGTKVYWLVSYPKSGNTWCRAFLLNYMNRDGCVYGINDLHYIPMINDHFMLERYLGIESSIFTEAELQEFRYEALQAFLKAGNPYRFLKVHDAFSEDQVPNLFEKDTTAGIIYVVRNPLDIVPSLANHMNVGIKEAIVMLNDSSFCMNGRTDKFEIGFKQHMGSWSEHVSSWINNSSCGICLIRYEDLLLEPVSTFRELVKYSGLEYDEKRLLRAMDLCSFENLKEQETKSGFHEKFAASDVFF